MKASSSIEPETMSFQQAADYLGMNVKRLRGIVWQQRALTCPIGDVNQDKLYRFSVERYKEHLAKQASSPNGD
jgi:hypothetical protein